MDAQHFDIGDTAHGVRVEIVRTDRECVRLSIIDFAEQDSKHISLSPWEVGKLIEMLQSAIDPRVR